MSSRTGIGGRRSCTDGPTKRRWEGIHRSCCKRFFQRHSMTSVRNFWGQTVGGGALKRPKRTERRGGGRADGPCGATSRNDPPPFWKRTTTLRNGSAGKKKFKASTRNLQSVPQISNP